MFLDFLKFITHLKVTLLKLERQAFQAQLCAVIVPQWGIAFRASRRTHPALFVVAYHCFALQVHRAGTAPCRRMYSSIPMFIRVRM